MRRKLHAVLFGLLPLSFVLMFVEEALLKSRVLNTKDLRGVAGAEKGTLFDYATNIWVWDGGILMLGIAGVIAALIGLIILIESKARLPKE